MAIQSSELRFHKPTSANDTASNGGRMSSVAIATTTKNNVWGDVPEAERVSGSVKYRKQFLKIANAANTVFSNVRVYVETPTPGSDRVVIFPGTQTDTQGDLTGSERLYGAGSLDATVITGATTIAVNVEAAIDAVFHDGDLIRISDKIAISDPNGNTEFVRLASPNGVSWNGSKATLVLASGQSLLTGYVAASTRVASCIEVPEIAATWSDWSGSSSVGTYDNHSPSTPPSTTVPILDWIASIEQTWTLTFTSASAFTCYGDTVGSLGSGSIISDFSPNNTAFGRPYFTLPSVGWGGTWAAGDTVTFKTHPAALAIWQQRIVPAGASSLSANKVIIGVTGESA